MLAQQRGLEFVDLNHTQVDPSVAALLSSSTRGATRRCPCASLSDGLVLVAVADPTNFLASDDLRLALGLNVRLAVASAPAIASAIGSCYRSEIDMESYTGEETADTGILEADDISDAGTSAPAIELVNRLVSRAIDDGASDLHVEPQANEVVVRARIDGVMQPRNDDSAEPPAGGDDPAQDHGRARHRRASGPAGRPRLDPSPRAPGGPAHGRPPDDARLRSIVRARTRTSCFVGEMLRTSRRRRQIAIQASQ